MQTSSANIFQDINSVINKEKIVIDGITIDLEFFLGGDYKFILLMMGLKGATSHYASVWRKVHKDDRWKMEFELNYYQSADLKRTLKEMIELSKKRMRKRNTAVNINL